MIDSSTFYGSGHVLLNVKSRCDLSDNQILDYPRGRIIDCDLFGNPIQTNGFAILDLGEACTYIDGVNIYNYSDTTWGRGIQVSGKQHCFGGGSAIKNTTIIAAERLASSQEYGGTEPHGIPVYGIQLEGAASCTLDNVNVTAISKDGSLNTGGVALRLNFSSTDSIFIRNSTFKGYNLGDEYASCLQFGSINEWSYDPATNPEWFVEDCEFVTNSIWIASISGTTNWKLIRPTFTTDFTTYGTGDHDMMALHGHTTYYPDTDSFKIIDPSWGSADADDTLRAAHIYKYTDSHGYLDQESDWLIGWNKPVHVIDAIGQDVAGAWVTYYNSVAGDTLWSGVADDSGYTVALMWEFWEIATSNTTWNRIDYNPGYTLKAKYGDAETAEAVTINSFATKEITLQFNEVITKRSVITK
jgi:hypothetical protein